MFLAVTAGSAVSLGEELNERFSSGIVIQGIDLSAVKAKGAGWTPHDHVSHIMNWHAGLSPVRSFSPISISSKGAPSLLRRFAGDQSGSYVILSAVLMPVLVGTAGLGTEVGCGTTNISTCRARQILAP